MPLGSLGRDDPGSAGAACAGNFLAAISLVLPLLEASLSIIEGSHPAVAASDASLSQDAWLK